VTPFDAPLPMLMTDPLETALWIDALADHAPGRDILRTGLDDLIEYLRRYRPRARA
jgi:hypothetical protein